MSSRLLRGALAVALLIWAAGAWAAETLPPAPARYLNDYAQLTRPEFAEHENEVLADFERKTSNQILVAIFHKMDSDSSVEDFTTRAYHAWRVGQKEISNGAVLFIFVQDRKTQIVTGYGLEGALPDATCKQIIETDIVPAFKQGAYEAGLSAAVDSMLKAAAGEYKGTGTTVYQTQHPAGSAAPTSSGFPIFPIILIALVFLFMLRRGRGTVYGSSGMSNIGWFVAGNLLGGGGRSSGGWGGGGGGGFSGGGGDSGGFSGGGGDTGGGGAGGSW